ncbi:ATP-dependent RNA helicase DEAH11, chloroplastic-like isoform X1 [Coffea eugenioides]|uniref:ATP-dependent RNA helicase DEAH11, chloroplastic-like isoform X1 n=1 Tax=Coffea eugenioides TaxID=49369 RepID=UPI000F612B7F|nr:ATP-dependent RNA helicase DEAH11, chloroplastic-like isoform X1 [Coffea eugenioides]
MQRPSSASSCGHRCYPPASYDRCGQVPFNHHQVRQPWKPQLSPNYRRDRPPGPPMVPSFRHHNFVIQLRLNSTEKRPEKLETEGLVSKLTCKPESYRVSNTGPVIGSLYYQQWVEALETMVQLWEIRLNNGHSLTPRLIQNVVVSSDKDELKDQLKTLFLSRLRALMEDESVNKWEKKLEMVLNERKEVNLNLKKRKQLREFHELKKKRDGLEKEGDLIAKRIEEFKRGIQCMVDYLEGKGVDEVEAVGVKVGLFMFGREFDWGKLHCLMMRECRRLDEGLPLFAFRGEIFQQIHCQQITVLIGETGSGKSTQLVQFLADSGVAGKGSIVCTQPRKLAAVSLAQRVKEESRGCYEDHSVISYPSYSSSQNYNSKVIFTTDHSLLQHYMRDKNLSRISCIIIDEAHERSLNTDLLLAMIKKLLHQRLDLRLVIMSATADAEQLANYFFGCGTFHVAGRNFPVDIRYVPCESEGKSDSSMVAPYVSDVVKMVYEIHKMDKEGTVLAFLTSQMEVEWACENFRSPSAIALPLHGKLTFEEQNQVFANYPGKRKVIFATNVAETSLTIPGVKYVVDSGMVKESKFEPGTGTNVLRVCRVSQSSANQRAGRAGRTEPGTCYRLYSESDFEIMPPHQEPEIRRVHLGVAVLRILALGIKNVQDFDFVDAPSPKAIEMALRNLIQLGAVTQRNILYELTPEGYDLVRLGIEPRLGKIILKCFHNRLGREGIVLAAVMANSSSIFCRVGSEESKLKSDRLKVQFCHQSGDLFTLLAVYKDWDAVPPVRKNIWCWENSINAKSMRRCQEAVQELESCLQNELSIIIPSYWRWNPQIHTEHDETLKSIILSAFVENVAMYSGYDHLGYEVALTRKHIPLHPSCSLLVFDQRPSWVVFGEILSASYQYLVCVTAFDFKSLAAVCPPPSFDFSKMESEKLHIRVLTGFGSLLLKRFCGKANSCLHRLVSCIRTECVDERIGVEVKVNENEVWLHASSKDMDKVSGFVNDALQYEGRLLQNECLEKRLYSGGPAVSPSVALFGAGGEIKHLELEKSCLTVDIFHSDMNCVNDKELLMFLEKSTSGTICAVHKFSAIGQESEEQEKWGRITFLSPDTAKRATQLNLVELCGGLLKVIPSRSTYGSDKKLPFPDLRAKVCWPRRYSKGIAIVKCEQEDIEALVNDFSDIIIGGRYARCEPSAKYMDSVVITGLDREISEDEIFEVLYTVTNRKIRDIFLLRGNTVEGPSPAACEEALLREISVFMPKTNPLGSCVRVQVSQPEPKDTYMRATIMFNGSLHLEAARALDEIDGKALPGCFSWQKMKCQHMFHSSIWCPASVYLVIRSQLDHLVKSFRCRKGVECNMEVNENGSCRVKISATATKTVAELRRPLEGLMKGNNIDDAAITPTVLQLLFSRDGLNVLNTIQRETGTYILFDKQALSLRVFGTTAKIEVAKKRLVKSLLRLHENKQLEVHLRGAVLPPDLMKRVVQKFGPDLHSLKEMFPGAEFSLNTKRHCICLKGVEDLKEGQGLGGTKDLKQKVEERIYEIARTSGSPNQNGNEEATCPICLCEVEDSYKLELCRHEFCRSCLVEQCDSAIKSQDSFPIRCARKGCGASVLLTDLRSLLLGEKFEELFRASLAAFVVGSGGVYRFCPSPDCPSVYRVTESGAPFVCDACYVETCTRCHLEYHPFLSCEKYKEFKVDPDSSLKEWCAGKENVKKCPVCRFTIEKVDGCNHIECRCGKHVCWVCLEFFESADDCYNHLRSIHLAII